MRDLKAYERNRMKEKFPKVELWAEKYYQQQNHLQVWSVGLRNIENRKKFVSPWFLDTIFFVDLLIVHESFSYEKLMFK